jgi:secreted PhoX family phosphatase
MQKKTTWLTAAAVLVMAVSAAAIDGADFGLFREDQLDAHSQQLFGIVSPVDASSEESIDAATADADPTRLVTLAKGLSARVVSAYPNTPPNVDMMALWPNAQNPTYLIACNEEETGQTAVFRIRLSDGAVQTMITGMTSCDPVRRTAWGTVIAGEEASDGWVIEMIDPLSINNVLFNRAAGTFSGGSGAANIASRPALGHLAFEGLALYPNGVLYYGDENRPSTGTGGGAYFKFIPTTPWAGGVVNSLSQSPLAAGQVYGLRLGKRSGNTDYGQGTNTGLGTWVLVPNSSGANLRTAAATLKLTGYYRPEDLEVDPMALAAGNVRFCGDNTGNESQDHNWGETVCVTDGTLAQATTNAAVPELQYLVLGTWDFAMMDNLAFQPNRGNWIIHEDGDGATFGRNNDLWSCLDDGDDADTLSDGCTRVGTLNDLTAEWTGGIFDATGTHFYVSVQHNITGHGVVLDITGWH